MNPKTLNTKLNTVICGDVMETLKSFPEKSIDCVITSPPYWQLRDYGWKGQWGLEPTFSEYLNHLWQMMDELKRVLKDEGTVWINLGDTYFGSGNDSGKKAGTQAQHLRNIKVGEAAPVNANTDKRNGLKRKCQVLIPHRFAIGCIERGWLVRNDIIWAKTNGVPESVTDRFSKRHEYIFLLTKQPDYYFDMDAVRQAHKKSAIERIKYKMTAYGGDQRNKKGSFGKGEKSGGTLKKVKLNPKGKNPGDVSDFWEISTKHGSSKHYATFNTELITKPILAGCPKGGIVLDPFAGTATTGIRAIELGRNFLGIEGKKQYCDIANKSLRDVLQFPDDMKTIIKTLSHLSFKQAA